MTVNYNVTGSRRKEMVAAIGAALGGGEPRYLGAPTFSYQVGDFEIGRNGALAFDDRTDSKLVERVLEALAQAGFEREDDPPMPQPLADPSRSEAKAEAQEDIAAMADADGEPEKTPGLPTGEAMDAAPDAGTDGEDADGEPMRLAVSLPRESFTPAALDNLDGLLESKGNLIRKAFGIEEASYTLESNRVTFAWMSGEIAPEEARAFQDFIGKLCEMARKLKRVTSKPKSYENEKYAFRCFLLRLGLIGTEYKASRKVLLRNLSGNSSWRDGHRKEVAHDEPSEP